MTYEFCFYKSIIKLMKLPKLASMNISSKLVENAVNQLSSLPGIGEKSALRLVLHMIKQEKQNINPIEIKAEILETEGSGDSSSLSPHRHPSSTPSSNELGAQNLADSE